MNKLLWAVPLLLMAALAVSSAATAFNLLVGFSGALKAAWRLQICSYAMLAIQAYDWYKRREDCRRMYQQHWRLILTSGVFFGLHFVLFAASLAETSIAHSLVLVCTSPIALILYGVIKRKPTHKWDVIGVGVSMVGIFFVVLDIGGNSGASLYGDILAVLSMSCIVKYYLTSQVMLKENQSPVLPFFAALNVVACLTAYICTWFSGESGLFFLWINPLTLIPVVYLGLVPGIVGHLTMNFLLAHISPLLISVFVNLEPVIGSFIGWTLGLQATPSFLLWLGGFITIAGNMIVAIYGSDNAASESKTPEGNFLNELAKPFK
jgi:drug/metabolite transporter (DMT)-like permease